MNVNFDRQTVNDAPASTSVVAELTGLLMAAISHVMETVASRASSDDGLTCHVDGLTGGANDHINDENGHANDENGRLNVENDLVDRENDCAGGETARVYGEIGRLDCESGRCAGETARVNGEIDLLDHENGGLDRENGRCGNDNGRTGGETPLHFDVVIPVEDLNVEQFSEGRGATKPKVQGFVAALRHDYSCGWDGVDTTVVAAGVAGAA